MKLILGNHYQKLLFILLNALIIFIPLYPKFPLLNVPGTYVAIRLEDFLIALAILSWMIYQFIYHRKMFIETHFQIFLLFWLTTLTSLLSALLITQSVTPHLGFLHWARRLEFMLLFWVAATSITTRHQLKIIVWIILITTILINFYGFGQLFLGFKVISTVDKDFSAGIISTLAPTGRVNSTFAGQYDLAIFLSFFLITCSALLFYIKNIWKRIGIILVSLSSFVLLGYTASRVSFIAAIAGIALVLFLNNKKKMIAILIIISILLVMAIPQFRARILATVNVSILKKVEKTYQPTPALEQKNLTEEQIAEQKAKQGLPRDIAAGESTNYTELEVGRSTSIRLTDEWPRATNALFKNPLLGTGYSSISLATDNDYLRSLGETGIIGFLSLMIIFTFLTKSFIAELKTDDNFKKTIHIIILAIFLDAALTAIFIDILEASKVACLFWIVAGIAWSATRHNHKKI